MHIEKSQQILQVQDILNKTLLQPNQQNKQFRSIQLLRHGYIAMGNAYLKPQIQFKYNLTLFNEIIIKKFKQKNWLFEGKINEQERLTWKKRFSFIVVAHNQNMSFAKSNDPQLLKNISHIRFQFLTNLNLFCAEIINYQALAFLDAQNLTSLNMIYTLGTNYQFLQKSNFPQLSGLFIYSCHPRIVNINNLDLQREINFEFVNLKYFSRCNFQLNGLRLEKQNYDHVIMQDLSFLAKAKGMPIQTIININKRICQKNVISALKRKRTIHHFSESQNKIARQVMQW